ncbi:glutathione S-transferase family protein [Coralliovum pocilloporae]|uniref:glutathione S-transferase family protein n=1 Tax=Coralliovum pocilloporae TaxID=3066369 RepID=UPI0033074B2E
MSETRYASVADFPISKRWPAQHPDRIQLYSFPTPNGVKVSIALEELGLPYEPHKVTLSDADVKSPEFLSLNPNNKIPAIIDPNGPDGQPIGLFESGAILVYLAQKTGKLMGKTEAEKLEVLQWLMFQMGGVGPMFGQLGFFYAFAGKEIEDDRPRNRYINEAKRLLNVVNTRLEGRDWIVNDFSIADIAIAPWLTTINKFYKAGDVTGFDSFENVAAYVERFNARPAAEAGWKIPARD